MLATPFRVVDLTDKADQEKGIQWWEELTASGGEGMVVKPLEFVTKGRKGLAQPAVKVRGREYLRIIYGPPLAEPFAAVDQMLIEQFGLERARLKSVFEIALANSSVLSYLQLGRPETISITSTDNADEFHAFLEAAAERANLPNQEASN